MLSALLMLQRLRGALSYGDCHVVEIVRRLGVAFVAVSEREREGELDD